MPNIMRLFSIIPHLPRQVIYSSLAIIVVVSIIAIGAEWAEELKFWVMGEFAGIIC